MTITEPRDAAERRALLPVGGAFVVFGMFWGSWAVATADVRATYHLSDAQLGLLLAAAVTTSGVVGAWVGNRAERWGAVPTLVRSLLVWAALLVLTGLARTGPEFALAFVAAMAAGGCVDMTMNAASASRLGDRPGALVRFHGIFNVGALVGALALGTLIHLGASWRWAWPAVAVLALPLALWVHLRGADPAPHPDRPAEAENHGLFLGADGKKARAEEHQHHDQHRELDDEKAAAQGLFQGLGTGIHRECLNGRLRRMVMRLAMVVAMVVGMRMIVIVVHVTGWADWPADCGTNRKGRCVRRK